MMLYLLFQVSMILKSSYVITLWSICYLLNIYITTLFGLICVLVYLSMRDSCGTLLSVLISESVCKMVCFLTLATLKFHSFMLVLCLYRSLNLI